MASEPKYDRDMFYQALQYLRDYQDRVEGHNDLQALLTIFDDMQSTIADLLAACKSWEELWDMRPMDSGEDIKKILRACWVKTEAAIAKATE